MTLDCSDKCWCKAPAADAGPRQCAECGHAESEHFSATMGSFCKHCPVDKNVWEHVFRPPVPQEAAASGTVATFMDMPIRLDSTMTVGQVDVQDSKGRRTIIPATAPDWARIVLYFRGDDNLPETVRYVAARIREAGSERERELEKALRPFSDPGNYPTEGAACWYCKEPDEEPHSAECPIVVAERLLGGEMTNDEYMMCLRENVLHVAKALRADNIEECRHALNSIALGLIP